MLQTTQQHGYAINNLLSDVEQQVTDLTALLAAFETGTFTPVWTFATLGDLSVAYTEQTGHFWRVGRMVFYIVNLQCTPTFTTSAGQLEITGLPYAAAAAPSTNIGSGQSSGGITFPAGYETIGPWLTASSSILQAIMQAGAAYTRTVATDVTSGAVAYLTLQGFYLTDDVAGI